MKYAMLSLMMMLCANAYGGAFILKDKMIPEVGEYKKVNGKIAVKTRYGTIHYSKNAMLWYTTSKKVKTYYDAGRAAERDERIKVALLFYRKEVATGGKNTTKARLRILKLTESDEG